MMPVGNLAKMVVANTVRSPRHFVLSAFGIVIGISTFVVFLASTEQVASVLERIFPVEQVQVVAPRAVFGTVDVSKKLDNQIVETIKARPEVARAVPRMALTFPAFGRGDFEGNDLRFEVGGFADGIDASFVTDDPRIRALFKDWGAEANDPNRVSCTPPPRSLDDEVIQSPKAPPDATEKKKATGWDDIAPNPGSGASSAHQPNAQPSGAQPRRQPTPRTRGQADADGQTDGGQPTAPPPSAGQPSAGQPSAGQPSARQPSGGQPTGGQPPTGMKAGGAGAGSANGTSGGTGSGTAAIGAGMGSGTAAIGAGTGSGTAANVANGGTPAGAGGPPAPSYFNPCPNPDRYYCDDTTRRCEHRVPVVMSPTMIELYNGQFAKSHGLPIADVDFVKFVTQRGGLGAMRFSVGLGLTTIAGSNTAIKQRPRRVEAVLVGISKNAMPIGMTMPIQYIQRWNREFMGEEAATTYSSIIVTLRDRTQIAPFAQWLQDKLDLRLEDSLGEKFATVLFVIRLVLVLISLIIIGISAINIAHNFFMQVTERRRELGLLRAVGATKRDVRMVVLGEAALIGLIGGMLGVLLGIGIAAGIDYASTHYLPPFPYKPKTWFDFRWWIWVGGLGCAAGFAVLGGYLPARKASTMEPAEALTQN